MTHAASQLDFLDRWAPSWLTAGESVSLDRPLPIVTVADTRVLRVRVEVDEKDVATLRLGQPAWVTAVAYGDMRFTGRVVRIGQMLGRKQIRTDDPTERVDTKVLEVLVELDPGQTLPVGLRVDAFIARQLAQRSARVSWRASGRNPSHTWTIPPSGATSNTVGVTRTGSAPGSGWITTSARTPCEARYVAIAASLRGAAATICSRSFRRPRSSTSLR